MASFLSPALNTLLNKIKYSSPSYRNEYDVLRNKKLAIGGGFGASVSGYRAHNSSSERVAGRLVFPVDAVNTKVFTSKTPSNREYLFVRPTSGRRGQFRMIRNQTSLESDLLPVEAVNDKIDYGVVGVHHVGILCENLERSVHFYQNILGLEINEARPHDKLPYRGAWLWVGSEMIHLMELPNPDPLLGRPEHGGRDRHSCISVRDVSKLKDILDKEGIPYTLSRSGRPAIFTRDPDANALEFTQVD